MSHKIDCVQCYIAGYAEGEKVGASVETERIADLLKSMSDWYYEKAIKRIWGTRNG